MDSFIYVYDLYIKASYLNGLLPLKLLSLKTISNMLIVLGDILPVGSGQLMVELWLIVLGLVYPALRHRVEHDRATIWLVSEVGPRYQFEHIIICKLLRLRFDVDWLQHIVIFVSLLHDESAKEVNHLLLVELKILMTNELPMQTKHVAELVHDDIAALRFSLGPYSSFSQLGEDGVTQLLVEAVKVPDCLEPGS